MKPTRIPALMDGNDHHKLCPVIALSEYINAVPAGEDDWMWIQPATQEKCTPNHLAKIMCSVIKTADPTSAPTAHEVRGYASSVAFARSLDALQVQQAGQWASCKTFINCYLNTQAEEAPCVAMGSIPQ